MTTTDFHHEYLVAHYCSEAVEFLPHGIIEKSHTGMGATHLELHSSRNSIIVEPLRVTARAKVRSLEENSANHNIMGIYVGGDAPADVFSLDLVDFRVFLETSSAIKKIICVADSFPKVYEVLLQQGLVNDYFLLIDEIDSFQMDSSFRYNLENCLDIYLDFPKENRAMLTATPIEFSDPRLTNENRTKFLKQEDSLIPLNFIATYDPLKLVAQNIINLLTSESTKNDQIVVALNSLTAIDQIIKTVKKYVPSKHLPPSDIGVLCGTNSKLKAGEFFKVLDNTKYPCKLNFITSAYFTGYDIEESYHLICAATTRISHSLLSGDQIKQIVGRLRKLTLLSNTVIIEPYNSKYPDSVSTYEEMEKISKADLTRVGNDIVSAYTCMNRNFSNRADTFSIYQFFIEGALEKLQKKNKAIVRKRYKTNNFELSNFFIDAKLAQKANFNNLYLNITKHSVINHLKEKGFQTIIQNIEKADIVLEAQSENLNEKLEHQILKQWWNLLQLENEDELLKRFERNNEQIETPKIRQLVELYTKYRKHLDILQFVHFAFDCLVQKDKQNQYNFKFKDSRSFDVFPHRLAYQFLEDDSSLFLLLQNRFPKGKVVTHTEISQLLSDCFNQSGFNILNGLLNGRKNTLKIFNIFFISTYTKRKAMGDERLYKIGDLKPKILKIKSN